MPDVTYDQAVLMAQGVETAGANLLEMSKPLRPIKTEPLHRFRVHTERERDSSAKWPRKPIVCTRFGTEGHSATVCRFKHEQCNHCKRNGHIA